MARGPHQRRMCSGRVEASNSRAAGALKLRAIRISRSEGRVIVALRVSIISCLLLLGLELRQVGIQAIECLVPLTAVQIQPVVDFSEGGRLQSAGPPLCLTPPRD